MHKLYVSALALSLIGGTAIAQSQGTNSARVLKTRTQEKPARHVQPHYSADRDVIWSDDFSNPSNWTMGSINDPNNDSWVIGTGAPSGDYAIDPIASTTAANGFAMFDSDLLCGGSQNAWIATANPIDLSNNASVVLTFEQYYENYYDSCFLETSTNGTTWTKVNVNANVAVNTYVPSNPDVVSLNLSSAIGGASTVWIRFRFLQGSNGCGYAWMVDDVSLSTLPDNELILDYGYTAQFGGGFEYSRVPFTQMPSSIDAGAAVRNFGGMAQTNVSASVSLLDENNVEVGSATSTITPSMASGETVVFDLPLTPTNTLPVGLYRAHFTLTSDQIGMDDNVNNNMKDRYFAVTADLYSLDALDVVPDSTLTLTSTGTDSFTDNTQDVRLLNYFEISTEETFTGVEVYVSNQTQVGSYFTAAVYDTTGVFVVGNQLSSPLVESDPRVITADDMVSQRPAVSFTDPITLAPGAYYVSANLFQEGGSNIRVIDDLTVPQPSEASALWIPIDPNSQNIYGGNGNAWAVRLSSLLNVGVQAIPSLKGITMYPSPTSGPLNIRAEKSSNMTVEVFNAMGAKVLTSSFTGTATTLNLAGNAAGMYTVRIGDGANFNMQRIVVK